MLVATFGVCFFTSDQVTVSHDLSKHVKACRHIYYNKMYIIVTAMGSYIFICAIKAIRCCQAGMVPGCHLVCFSVLPPPPQICSYGTGWIILHVGSRFRTTRSPLSSGPFLQSPSGYKTCEHAAKNRCAEEMEGEPPFLIKQQWAFVFGVLATDICCSSIGQSTVPNGRKWP